MATSLGTPVHSNATLSSQLKLFFLLEYIILKCVSNFFVLPVYIHGESRIFETSPTIFQSTTTPSLHITTTSVLNHHLINTFPTMSLKTEAFSQLSLHRGCVSVYPCLSSIRNVHSLLVYSGIQCRSGVVALVWICEPRLIHLNITDRNKQSWEINSDNIKWKSPEKTKCGIKK